MRRLGGSTLSRPRRDRGSATAGRRCPLGPEAGEAGGARRLAGRIGGRWTDEQELADAIHGTVVGAAVLVAASLHGTLVQVVITVVATLLVYWATERYAELLAAGARGRVLTRPSVVAALGRGWPMLESSYAPVIVLLSRPPSARSYGAPCWGRCARPPCCSPALPTPQRVTPAPRRPAL